MRSIIQEDREHCYLCGKPAYWREDGLYERIEEHHVFFGNPRKKLSEKYGLKVYLHGDGCHRNGKDSPHKNRIIADMLRAAGQKRFEEVHGSREEFVEVFGKNYLG